MYEGLCGPSEKKLVIKMDKDSNNNADIKGNFSSILKRHLTFIMNKTHATTDKA